MEVDLKRRRTEHPAFKIETQKFQGNFPSFRKPQEVGYFRQDERRNFVHGPNKQIKYLITDTGSVNFDLKKGYNTFVKRDETVKEYLDDLLRWICENKTKFQLQASNSESIATTVKRFKLLKWWCQSFLLGIGKIVCGFRDDDSIVHRLETYYTQSIPKFCEDIYNPWQPTVCFNFLDQFLAYVKTIVSRDDPKLAYVFTWSPGAAVEWSESTESANQFIPDWYCDWWNNGT